jgi:hypothetical protein
MNCIDGNWSVRRVGVLAVAVLVALLVSFTLLASSAQAYLYDNEAGNFARVCSNEPASIKMIETFGWNGYYRHGYTWQYTTRYNSNSVGVMAQDFWYFPSPYSLWRVRHWVVVNERSDGTKYCYSVQYNSGPTAVG